MDSVKDYYDNPGQAEGVRGAGLIWYLGQDHLSPSYDNSDEIALDPGMWRDGASRRIVNLAKRMGIRSGAKVLDFGSGIGGPGRDIQAATGSTIYGINLSFNQLLSSRELNSSFDHLVNADGHFLPFLANTFDDAYSINMFYHLSDPGRAIGEVARVLKKDGKFGLDDWFLTEKSTQATIDTLRYRWSSPGGFHQVDAIQKLLTEHGLEPVDEVDFTQEAADFLTEERFGSAFDKHVKNTLIAAFPKLYQYPNYQPEHAQQAADQLRGDILYMGELYRNGQAAYRQLIAEKK